MNHPNTVSIRCKPFVAHYLRLKYPLQGNVIDLPRKSKIRATFLSCLSKNFTHSDHQKNGLHEEVMIFINDDLVQKHGNTIPEAFCAHFNSVMEEKIKSEAFHIINLIRITRKCKPKEAILEFQTIYDFGDTFSFDAIKSDYYRTLREAEQIFKKKETDTK